MAPRVSSKRVGRDPDVESWRKSTDKGEIEFIRTLQRMLGQVQNTLGTTYGLTILPGYIQELLLVITDGMEELNMSDVARSLRYVAAGNHMRPSEDIRDAYEALENLANLRTYGYYETPEPIHGLHIHHRGCIVRRGRSLAVINRHLTNRGTRRVTLFKNSARLSIEFGDGSTVDSYFASYEVAKDWITRKHWFKGALIEYR